MREHGAGNEATIATLLDLERDLVQALAQHAASVPPPAPVATPGVPAGGGGGGVPPAPVATPGVPAVVVSLQLLLQLLEYLLVVVVSHHQVKQLLPSCG